MNYRLIFLSFLYLQSFHISNAQLVELKAFIELKDSIISRYNRGDYRGVYDLSAESFRSQISETSFIEFLNRVNQFGSIQSSALTEDFGSMKFFKLEMQKGNLELQVSSTARLRYNTFAIAPLQPYDSAYVKNIRTDNPLRSALDSAIDRSAKKHMSNKSVAGLSIGIFKNGKVYEYDYGEIEQGKGSLPSPDTYYEIGSITKTFTGFVLAKAVLQKKIKLEDDIRKYLPDSFPNLQYKGEPIKVVHLSNHSSRIPSLPADFMQQNPYDPSNPYLNYSKEMFWNGLHKISIDTTPGTKYAYSNMGVSLLGYILEKVYQKNYETLVEEYITGPLKMKDTKFLITGSDQDRFAQGHNAGGQPTSHWDLPSFAAAGAIRSTINDMLKYLRFNLDEKNEVIKFSHQLTRGTIDNGIALNWFVAKTLTGFTKYEHDGGTGGFRTMLCLIPDLQAGYVVFSNNSIDLGNLNREIIHIITKN